MKKVVTIIVSFIFVFGCSPKKHQTGPIEYNVVPKTASITPGTEWISWEKDIVLIASSDDEKNAAVVLQDFLQTKNNKSTILSTAASGDKPIIFSITKEKFSSNEAYKLLINENGVTISAGSGAGLFYGVQTLFQLMASDETGFSLPRTEINDSPRFSWRGLHLDVGRHFFSVSFIKKYIDLMSHYKLNTFHWHLTEDQGWRIEIKKYPKLQEISAYRKETVIGRASTRTRNDGTAKFDGVRHGGYYTQEEIKEVVAYASARHVTVLPEIEMPGHALAALAAYPYLGCTGGPYEVATTWGVFDDVFCAGKETTFQFLQDVLDEILPLFPGKYVHIGGDECPKSKWKKCPHCQQRMKTEKIKDEHGLQSYFIQRMEKYINSKGKSIIGWDEILEGGLAPNAAVMSWRGEEGGIAAAQQNHDVVMTPAKWVYLDYYQDTTKNEPLAGGGFVPVSKVYSYDPVPSSLTADQATHVLGTQANVWSEYMTTGDQVEYMVFPRAIALAEVAWSPKENRNYDDFVIRLQSNRNLLDGWNVNYAKHAFKIKSDSIK